MVTTTKPPEWMNFLVCEIYLPNSASIGIFFVTTVKLAKQKVILIVKRQKIIIFLLLNWVLVWLVYVQARFTQMSD